MPPPSHPDPPLPRLPSRAADCHKGHFGHALLVGGSQGMAGAVALAGMAALRSGAGRVTVAVPDVCQPTVAGFEPSYMTRGLASDPEGRFAAESDAAIKTLAAQATAIGLGPGLGRSEALVELVGELYEQLPQPMIVDADALHALSMRRDLLPTHAAARILTPHSGEFDRLSGEAGLSREEQVSLAVGLADRWNVTLVLKGHRSVITDGKTQTTNITGNPGMATGGTGDVLTGVITALVCQGLSPQSAARLGAHVHGIAGDLAAARLGEVGLVASDLIDDLPAAMLQVSSEGA